MTLLTVGHFFTVFPTFWCLIMLLLSFVGGWRRLAEHYATDTEPRGTAFRWISGRVGSVNYNNCLTAQVTRDGMHLSTPWLFRVGHKPLFIPWHAIHDEQPIRFLWLDAVRFEVGKPTIARIQLPRKVIEARGA